LPRRDWTNTLFISGLHLLALLGLYFWPRPVDLVLFLVLYLITGFGITGGYHRLLTHRAFECPTWLRRLFGIFGAAALEGSPLVWVGTHRRHHRYSDKEGDPHSPLASFWHGHVGWMFVWRDQNVDRSFAKELARDPFFRALDSWHFFVWLSTLGACYLIAGWRGVLWGGIVRTVWTWNITWAVNSFCHVFGRRSYKTSDGSRNLWWVGVLALGEGWHNNHHHYQRSAYAGETVAQVDVTGYVLRGLEAVGLIWDVRRPKVWLAGAPASPILGELRTEEGAARVLAAPTLSAFKGSTTVNELIQALEDESAAVRARVIAALGKIGDSRAVDALIPHLSDNVTTVCREAAIALGQLAPTAESLAALRAALSHRAEEVAEAAALARRRLESASAAAG
jgi:stearoyl-CoA desaturase (Delta-9 desaturase)